MKKIAALVLALPLMAATVFAEPVGIAAGILQTTDTVSEAKEAAGPLFADISVPQLGTTEAEDVEGEGPIGAAVGGILGGIAGAFIYCTMYGNFSQNISRGFSGVGGACAVIGGFIGL
jgi:hypothetical protein